MLNQDVLATAQALADCTELLVKMAQVLQPQPLFSQLQLQFCIVRVLVLMKEGRYVELQKSGIHFDLQLKIQSINHSFGQSALLSFIC